MGKKRKQTIESPGRVLRGKVREQKWRWKDAIEDQKVFEEAEITLPESKQAISLRVDRDVLAWFKAQGRGYQTRMNAVLRLYMESKQ